MTQHIQKTLEELKEKLPQEILGALEYRGFYDCGKYLDETIYKHIEPILSQSLTEQHERDVQSFREKVEGMKKNYVSDDYDEKLLGYDTALDELLANLDETEK